jgi:hypothetical protein
MEVHRVAHPSAQVTDLFHPDCTVPTTDPGIRLSQPRPAPRRRRREKVLKSVPWASLRSSTLTQDTLDAVQDRQAMDGAQREDRRVEDNNDCLVSGHQTQQLDSEHIEPTSRAPSQCSSNPTILEKITTKTSMLRLLFWKRVKPQQTTPDIVNEPPSHELASVVSSVGNPVPALVVVDDDAPALTGAGSTSSQHVPTEVNSAANSGPSVLHPDLSQPSSQPPEIDQGQLAVASVTHDSGVGLEVPDVHAMVTGADLVLEPIDSTKLYNPEQGVFVGKLYELPPPALALGEWCHEVRPELIKNLMTVIASLPPSYSRAETTIEPELCMSGTIVQGHPTVALTPTIWIRCGSKTCQKAVQRAIADLSHVKRFPVHVTLHAPRPASAGSAPVNLSGASKMPKPDNADQIAPARSKQPTHAARRGVASLSTQSPLKIRVQSFAGAQRSACGLRVEFSTSDGTCYTCTLGGLVMLNNTVFGLTTAHTICDYAAHVTRPFQASRLHNSRAAREKDGDSDEDTSARLPRGSQRSTLSATLFAAKFGKLCFPPRTATPDLMTLGPGLNHDFALLQLHPQQSQNARNAYMTSQGHKVIDRTSGDLTGRAVHLLCSSRNVVPGHLLDGDCVLFDKEGSWETRKIQLISPLGKQAVQCMLHGKTKNSSE